MALRLAAEPVKMFMAMLSSKPELFDRAAAALVLPLGPVDRESELYPFVHTTYYADEMGETPLQRKFIAFDAVRCPSTLPEMKILATAIEEQYAIDGKRQINLDPGYLDFNKVVLASYKFGAQKIYLRDGVYADIVLLYAKGNYDPFVWTFPDFSSGTYSRYFLDVRRRYKQQQRENVRP